MSFNFSIPLTGIGVNFTRLHATADNIARHNVPNAAKTRVNQQSLPKGGVEATTERIPVPPELQSADPYSYDSTNIDYAEESVNHIVTKTAFRPNFRVAEVMDEMFSTLINIKV
ncbi:MAG: hypothetical protein HY696_12640 [Deltaproteobacteria bacterium]|nr:hypothetical protein [Deltaproteobacteria bacterium]